ncbi:MAG: PhzF family phenazine biosynthesis protein [Clostridia bacterium]|nr:PhzF family phenazine biosynthesis protein [Clostridia bacterium]
MNYTSAIVDAFTNEPYSGNPAGVVYLGGDPFPGEDICVKAAAELRFSETAFIRKLTETEYAVRYFTPVCEAALCGHATVASFSFLREKKLCGLGDMLVHTKSGDIRVTVGRDSIRLDMAEARTIKVFSGEEARELYRAFGLPEREKEAGLSPAAVGVGLDDILLPVKDEAELNAAKQDEAAVSELSKRHNVTGVHMFCLTEDGFAAHCRNFAPLCGIPEECATGTSSGALCHYLAENGLVPGDGPAAFMQGEAMGRPSVITAYIENGRVRVGGPAAVVMEGKIQLTV